MNGTLVPAIVCIQKTVCEGNDFTDGGSQSRSRGSPSRGRGGLCHRHPPYGNKRAVRILLECILVLNCALIILLNLIKCTLVVSFSIGADKKRCLKRTKIKPFLFYADCVLFMFRYLGPVV